MQVTASARYYSSEMGRFINRDPIATSQNPRTIMAQNHARHKYGPTGGFIQRTGYHDGMSLYNGYFAEKFGLDPNGMEFKKKFDPKPRWVLNHKLFPTRAFNVKGFFPKGKVSFDKTTTPKCYRVKLEGTLKVHIAGLGVGHKLWKTHYERYDKKWGKERTDADEMSATLSHEMDHYDTYTKGLWPLLVKLNAIEKKKFATKPLAEAARDKIIQEAKDLKKAARTHSLTFDGKDRNSGDEYKNHPFKKK